MISDSHVPLDLVVTAGRIDTGEGGQTGISALGVRRGLIVALGTSAEAADWPVAGSTAHHDFAGATVCAGLSDPHSHPVHGLLGMRGIDLGEVQNSRQLAARLSAEAERLDPGQWIIGRDLHPEVFEGDPNSEPLDLGSPKNPVFLRLIDFHAGVANSCALKEAGITGPTPLPGAAEVVLDTAGAPTGYLKEFAAMRLVEDMAPVQSDRERADALLQLLREMAASGLTATHSLTFDHSCVTALELIEADTDLPLRVRLSPVCRSGAQDGDYTIDEIIRMQGIGGRDWLIEGAKFFLDGTIDNGTAWLREADTFGESTRSVWDDPQQYSAALRQFHDAGIPTATHAIGDAAVQHALRVIASLERRENSPRHRIEHVEIADDELVHEFAASGAIASMQPAHAAMSLGVDGSSVFSRRLAERTGTVFRVRSLIEAGVVVALGSDWPTGPFDPRTIMAMARTRRAPGTGMDPVLPAEAVTARQALTAYTSAVATLHGTETTEGVIALGALADLTIFESDPLTVEADALEDVPVLATFVAGRRT